MADALSIDRLPDVEAQAASFYPAIPSPVTARLVDLPVHDCSYLPGRRAQSRGLLASRIAPRVYDAMMDSGFRRSGRLVYQPICRGCRSCQPLRVPVASFRPDKSQRRCARRNADLEVEVGPAVPTDEKFTVYQQYQVEWHGKQKEPDEDGSPQEEYASFVSFLYDSPVDTVEFLYRDPASRQLLAVGICDVTAAGLSSVYFYFDPEFAWRSLGTYGAIREIAYARASGLKYYFLGYWVEGCASMRYKSAFRPCEVLCGDGVWRPA